MLTNKHYGQLLKKVFSYNSAVIDKASFQIF